MQVLTLLTQPPCAFLYVVVLGHARLCSSARKASPSLSISKPTYPYLYLLVLQSSSFAVAPFLPLPRSLTHRSITSDSLPLAAVTVHHSNQKHSKHWQSVHA